MAKQGGGMDTVNEMPAARRSIVPAYLLETPTGQHFVLSLYELRAQQPSRLHRHGDPFADDGVRFAGGITDKEKPIPIIAAEARTNRTGSQPGSLEARLCKDLTRPSTGLLDILHNCFSCPQLGSLGTRALHRVTADTAAKGYPCAIGLDNASITTRKSQYGHKSWGQHTVA
jgi:hypothetical protein